MAYRSNRLAEELKNEISRIVNQELRDPRVGFVTITTVKVSPDLKYARIYFSVLGSEDEKKATLEALSSAAGFIRRQIGLRIKLRHVPEMTFSYDDTVEHGDRMMRIFEDIKKELPQ
ncbi:MAG: 30S ribosome-binding factor RbfA [Acidobacteria bacterium]|jgi:ribosome-binding factor A|nr:30S ribosome-binding factor RbfA [Acidobacteriota bacterium]MBK8313363.1 30S ribosome-binding factor RbfA [Acidobacteriota bacterium]MBK9707910.1 30S ribosome-binding factor RbfA [Acidobacteriota bacterium]